MRLSKFISDQVPSLLRRFLFRDVSEKCEVVRFRFLRICVSLFFDLAEICDFVFRPHMFCRKINWSCKAMTDLFDPAQFLVLGVASSNPFKVEFFRTSSKKLSVPKRGRLPWKHVVP